MKYVSTKSLTQKILRVDKDELLALSANAEEFYKPFTIEKICRDGSIKKRVIEPPEKNSYLLEIQKRIYHRILKNAVQNLPDNVLGGRPGKTILDNALIHRYAKEMMKFDIKDFFPSVSRKCVFNIFRNELHFCEEASNLLSYLTTFNGHLPQGAPTSPSLAMISLNGMYKSLSNYCAPNNLQWSVWLDDIAISSKEKNLREHMWRIKNIMNNIPFIINDKKVTGIIKVGSKKDNASRATMSVTGLCIHGNGIITAGQKKKKLKRKILTTKNGSKSIQGKIDFIKMIEPEYGKNLERIYNQKISRI